MVYKEVLGYTATFIALYSYIPYLKDIFANKTKPHTITWLIWGVLCAVAFIGQLSANAGPGAWVTGITALLCLFITILSITKTRIEIVFIDWLSLISAAAILFIWFLTKNPLLAIILTTTINSLGFIPTFRKSYNNPFDETLSAYFLGALKFIIALYALSSFSFVTVIFPLSIIISSLSFCGMVIIRRAQMTNDTLFPTYKLAFMKDYISNTIEEDMRNWEWE